MYRQAIFTEMFIKCKNRGCIDTHCVVCVSFNVRNSKSLKVEAVIRNVAWCCTARLLHVVLHGPTFTCGAARPDFYMWCCTARLLHVVLHGPTFTCGAARWQHRKEKIVFVKSHPVSLAGAATCIILSSHPVSLAGAATCIILSSHPVSLAGAATCIIFVATKVLLQQTHVHRSNTCLSQQNMSFAATKVCLSQQNCCCNKHIFVASNIILL